MFLKLSNFLLEEFKCDNGAIFDIEWHDFSTKFIIASNNSNNLLWDAEKGQPVFDMNVQNSNIRTIKSCVFNTSSAILLF